MIIILFFVTQSLSILKANNIIEFLKVYKNIITGIFLYFISFKIVNWKMTITFLNKIVFLIISTNLLIQFILYFKPQPFFDFLSMFLHPEFLSSFEIRAYYTNKFFSGFFNESFIPFLVFSINKKRPACLIFTLILLIIILYFSNLSNFRVNALVFIFSTIVSLYLVKKNKHFLTFFFFIFLILFLFLFFFNFFKTGSFRRMIDFQEAENLSTILTRLNLWSFSFELFKYSPLLGIGINNFYDFLNPKIRLLDPLRQKLFEITYNNPHNIFVSTISESGLLGFLSLLILIGYFLKSDFSMIKKLSKKKRTKEEKIIPFVISFWSLIIFSLFMPTYSLNYNILFWFNRAIIEMNKKHAN